jgi:hypothetical protein
VVGLGNEEASLIGRKKEPPTNKERAVSYHVKRAIASRFQIAD